MLQQSLTRKFKQSAVCVATALATFLLGANAGAYAQQPNTAGAIQAFQQLPPDQQQAILQRLGGQSGGPSGAPGGQGAPGTGNAAQNQGNAAANAAQGANPNGSANSSQKLPIPVFGPGDWVLLDINLPGEKSVAQQAADIYARDLNAAAIQALTGQAMPAQPAPTQNPNASTQTGGNNPANPPLSATTATPANVNAGANAGNRNNLTPLQQKLSQSAEEQRKLDAQRNLIKMLHGNNPFQLDRDGVLQLPGFRSIELGGLTEAEATRRVASEPALEDFEIRVIRLPVAKSGKEALQPYGYDLFNGQQGLAPVTSTPESA